MNVGRVLTHDELLRRLWGRNRPGDPRALLTHLRRLRSSLGDDASSPIYVFTELCVSHRMAENRRARSDSTVGPAKG